MVIPSTVQNANEANSNSQNYNILSKAGINV